MFDLLFLLIVTWLIFSRLFMILGKQDEQDERRKSSHVDDMLNNIPEAEIIDLKPNFEAELPKNVQSFCAMMRKHDNSFRADKFVDGAKKAYEAIFDANNTNNQKILSMLVDDKLLNTMNKKRDILTKKGHVQENTLVGIVDIAIEKAVIKEQVASIVIRLSSEQIILIKDKDNKVVAGDASFIEEISESLEFKRDLALNNNIWLLAKTNA